MKFKNLFNYIIFNLFLFVDFSGSIPIYGICLAQENLTNSYQLIFSRFLIGQEHALRLREAFQIKNGVGTF